MIVHPKHANIIHPFLDEISKKNIGNIRKTPLNNAKTRLLFYYYFLTYTANVSRELFDWQLFLYIHLYVELFLYIHLCVELFIVLPLVC